MRGITLALVAFLAMASASFGAVTLRFYEDDLYVGNGYKSYIVTVEGTNINELGEFTITGSGAWCLRAPLPRPTPRTNFSLGWAVPFRWPSLPGTAPTESTDPSWQ